MCVLRFFRFWERRLKGYDVWSIDSICFTCSRINRNPSNKKQNNHFKTGNCNISLRVEVKNYKSTEQRVKIFKFSSSHLAGSLTLVRLLNNNNYYYCYQNMFLRRFLTGRVGEPRAHAYRNDKIYSSPVFLSAQVIIIREIL